MYNKLDCVVSLTTWKGRIADEDTAKAIYSLIRQKTQYNYKVILTLSKEEFPNLEKDLPEKIKLFYENELIDIIWADGNYKALKKIYPISTMYDCPILTTDDDIICSEDIVECFMNEHLKNKNVVLSEQGICKYGLNLTGGFRLFPNKIINVEPNIFKDKFNCLEDDVYISILLKKKNVNILYLNTKKIKEIPNKQNDETALRLKYNKFNFENVVKEFL